ncbi:MAG: hypothetical protein ACFFDF_24895 [Candidatus Odinarchaeota archaeon]
MRAIEKRLDLKNVEELKEDLEELRKYLNYKNHNFLKKFLDNILKKYFENIKEV